MNPIANDWASSDPTQNLTLAEADQFQNGLAAALAVQFGDRFVKTTNGETVSETELRRNNPLPAAAVNLWGTLAGVAPEPLNLAEMRASIRSAATGNNPVGDLENLLRQGLPKSDIQSIVLRAPAIQAAVRNAIAGI
jgi:hypothetical protein